MKSLWLLSVATWPIQIKSKKKLFSNCDFTAVEIADKQHAQLRALTWWTLALRVDDLESLNKFHSINVFEKTNNWKREKIRNRYSSIYLFAFRMHVWMECLSLWFWKCVPRTDKHSTTCSSAPHVHFFIRVNTEVGWVFFCAKRYRVQCWLLQWCGTKNI